jgi:hypothetical protein
MYNRLGGILIGSTLAVGLLVTGEFFAGLVLTAATLWYATEL